MSTLFTESENNEKPPERESEPSGDGSPERSPTPRGSSEMQAKLVSDDTEAYEDQQTGIAISYQLDEKEAYRFLRYDGFSSPVGIKILIIFAALIVVGVVCLVLGVRPDVGGWVLCLGAFLIAAAIWFLRLPIRKLHNMAKRAVNTGEGKINLEIYPDHIDALLEKEQLEIPLDGTTECAHIQNIFGLYFLREDGPKPEVPILLLLPLRCIDESVLPDVEAMILAGTKPKNLRKVF